MIKEKIMTLNELDKISYNTMKDCIILLTEDKNNLTKEEIKLYKNLADNCLKIMNNLMSINKFNQKYHDTE